MKIYPYKPCTSTLLYHIYRNKLCSYDNNKSNKLQGDKLHSTHKYAIQNMMKTKSSPIPIQKNIITHK